MRQALYLIVLGAILGTSSPLIAQTRVQVRTFNREAYLRETNPAALEVYHWAVYRTCINPENRNYIGTEAHRIIYGYIRSERYVQRRLVRGVSVNEFRRRPKAYGGITHGKVNRNVNVGPLWVTKRAADYVAPYDFIREGEDEVLISGPLLRWHADDIPPPLDGYWPNNTRPDWFNQKVYRLFVPHEETSWWSKTDAGQWDLIDKGELQQENGDGPNLKGPKVKFEGNY